MLLYVLTTDGGSREDANVFYARYLMVDVADERKSEVDAKLKELLGIESFSWQNRYDHDAGEEHELDVLYSEDEDELARQLTDAGFPTTVPKPELLVMANE